jgi:hypothetical protein
MLGQLFNVLDNTLGPILSQINNVLGGILGSVSSIISQALKYANLFLSILGCDELKCPTPTNWSARYGPAQGDIDNFNKILGNASLSSLVSPGLQEVDDMIPSNAGAGVPDCSSNVFRCGPPLLLVVVEKVQLVVQSSMQSETLLVLQLITLDLDLQILH